MDEKKICVREARVSDAEALCEIYAYYVKNTKDDIAVVSTSTASGYGSMIMNVGEKYGDHL